MSLFNVSYWQALYQRPVDKDTREPIFLYNAGDASVGLLAPDPSFWMQLSVLLTVQSVFNVVMAILIYNLVVLKRGSTMAFLAGYGIICPLVLSVPFQFALWFEVRNTAILVGLGASIALVLFRCLMAIHGTNPPFAERNARNFVTFYVAPLQFNFDSKTGELVRATKPEMQRKLLLLCRAHLMTCLVFGVMIHYNFELFPRRQVNSFLDLFHYRNLLNNYAMAYLTGVGLDVGTRTVGFMIECVSGNSVMELSDSPLTASTSPSDFWGRRWNALVHFVLKRAIYLPLLQNGCSKAVAGLGTFFISGVFHEYVIAMLTFRSDFTPRYGYHLAFFAWNGVVLILEHVLSNHPVVKLMRRNLPSPVITFLVIMAVLPIAHWFTDEYVTFGFYKGVAIGMPQIVWLPVE